MIIIHAISPTLGGHLDASDPQICLFVFRPFRPVYCQYGLESRIRCLNHKLVHIVHLSDNGLSLHHL